VELGAPDVVDLGPNAINAEWSGNQNAGSVTMGSFIFSDDAQGTWSLAVFESYNKQANFIGGTLSGGELIVDFDKGDANGDDFIGIEDLNVVLGDWNQSSPTNPAADINGDGFVGIEDLNIVLGKWNADMTQGPWDYNPTGLPGDLDGDEYVALSDLNLVLGEWHNHVTPGDLADPNEDGFVGMDDMNIVLTYFYTGTPPIALPEPASLALLSLSGLVLLKRG
jgi:hypothetical protein